MKKPSVWVFVFLLAFRLFSVFGIAPGNAPDEVGHMVQVVALSQGRLLTLQESLSYAGYPYAVYNPIPYLPSAAALFVASRFDPSRSLNLLTQPVRFSARAFYIARLGALFWFCLFAVFLLKLTEEIPFRERAILLSCVGLLPQLIFVQSYVNLDSMGVGVLAYLVWALKARRWRQCGIAVFLVTTAKLNYFCLLVLPAWLLLEWYRHQWRSFLKLSIGTLIVPFGIGCLWFLYNYQFNTGTYQSFLGFDALNAIYHSSISGSKVFSLTFLSVSLRSAFGLFGYMDQPIQPFFTYFFRLIIFPFGIAVLFKYAFSKKEPPDLVPWHRALFLVFATNWALHYYASYSGAYQPQGRYLFPAILILFGYITYGLHRYFVRIPSYVVAGVVSFMLIAALCGYQCSARIHGDCSRLKCSQVVSATFEAPAISPWSVAVGLFGFGLQALQPQTKGLRQVIGQQIKRMDS